MLKISETGLNVINERAKATMEEIAQGKPLRETLCGIYVAGLPDKTEKQGLLIADRVIQSVMKYTAECNAAMENLDQWMAGKLDEMLAGKSTQERCQLLFQLINAFTAVNATALSERLSGSGMTADEIAAGLKDKKLDPAAIDAQLEAQLREQVLAAMSSSGIVLSQLDEIADALEGHSGGDAIEKYVVDFGIKAADYKAVAAMIAYVCAKNGTIEDVPSDAGVDEITVGVCAGIEAQRVAAEVEKGSLSETVAEVILTVLGVVAAVILVWGVLEFGYIVGSLLIGGVLGIFAGIALSAVVLHYFGEPIMKLVGDVLGFVVKTGVAVVSLVIKGLRALVSWVAKTAAPAVVGAIKRGAQFVKSLFAKGAAVEATTVSSDETVAAPAN